MTHILYLVQWELFPAVCLMINHIRLTTQSRFHESCLSRATLFGPCKRFRKRILTQLDLMISLILLSPQMALLALRAQEIISESSSRFDVDVSVQARKALSSNTFVASFYMFCPVFTCPSIYMAHDPLLANKISEEGRRRTGRSKLRPRCWRGDWRISKVLLHLWYVCLEFARLIPNKSVPRNVLCESLTIFLQTQEMSSTLLHGSLMQQKLARFYAQLPFAIIFPAVHRASSICILVHQYFSRCKRLNTF